MYHVYVYRYICKYHHWGRLGYFSNERGISVECTLQSISSNVFLVETNQLVGSNPNVILMQQICGQRSSIFAGSKRRALAFYFSVRICCMFPISKCRGESDLGLCTALHNSAQFCTTLRVANSMRWRLPIKQRVRLHNSLEVGTADLNIYKYGSMIMMALHK